ncbi:MAG: winged helix-turn-helix transcriptional regulator [Fusobacterium necrophorum]|nr:winged helix-turn-helix transcriptional regulator [Fusobacterium necrophorum]
MNLRNENGDYNLLAELLSDRNNIPFIFVKFQGNDKSSISERSDYGYGCLLTTYGKIKNRLQAENICISDTTVRPRKDIYLFDYDAVNEAILNALVHNDWTITEPQISMFHNRLEILSHGGLPSGMTEKQFFDGISKPRNTTLMRIFLNMGLTEHTGHGIPTIVNKYGKEVFEIEGNYIRCTIPFERYVLANFDNKNVGLNVGLNKTEKKVIELLIENPSYNSEDLAEKIGMTKRTIERTFKTLQEKKRIERIGSKRDGNWIVTK